MGPDLLTVYAHHVARISFGPRSVCRRCRVRSPTGLLDPRALCALGHRGRTRSLDPARTPCSPLAKSPRQRSPNPRSHRLRRESRAPDLGSTQHRNAPVSSAGSAGSTVSAVPAVSAPSGRGSTAELPGEEASQACGHHDRDRSPCRHRRGHRRHDSEHAARRGGSGTRVPGRHRRWAGEPRERACRSEHGDLTAWLRQRRDACLRHRTHHRPGRHRDGAEPSRFGCQLVRCRRRADGRDGTPDAECAGHLPARGPHRDGRAGCGARRERTAGAREMADHHTARLRVSRRQQPCLRYDNRLGACHPRARRVLHLGGQPARQLGSVHRLPWHLPGRRV
ncbi:hypothetical protein ACFPRL_31615 [Pseudoclavibacter helvolus]